MPKDNVNYKMVEFGVKLTLAYDGEFGFQAILTVNMDAKNAGLYANLFYYNEKSGELEFVCAGEIDEKGNAELVFSHASDYTIVIDTQSMETVETTKEIDNAEDPAQTENDTAPDDGEERSTGYLWFMLLGILIVLAAAGVVFAVKKKKEEYEK